MSQPQGHSVAGRIMSLKNPNDPIGKRIPDLLACGIVPQLCHCTYSGYTSPYFNNICSRFTWRNIKNYTL